jgi:hypothetical protein
MVKSPDDPNRSEKNKRHWLDHAAVWAASGAALAAAAAAAVGAWQGWIATQGVTEARRANEIAIRPYIKVDLLPDTFAIGPISSRGGTVMSIQFTIENTGKLPAPATIQASIGWQASHHPLDRNAFRSYEGLGQRFLFPNQESGRITKYTNVLSDGELIDLKNGAGRSFYISAQVLYGPDKQHLEDRAVQICMVFPINDSMRLGPAEPCPEEDSNYAR